MCSNALLKALATPDPGLVQEDRAPIDPLNSEAPTKRLDGLIELYSKYKSMLSAKS